MTTTLAITPVRCPAKDCHWAAHGIPDKYTEARAWHLAVHRAEEHGKPLTAEQIAWGKARGYDLPKTRDDEPTTAPAPPGREAEIRESHPGNWYGGPWYSEYVDGQAEEPAYYRVVHQESGTTLATLPDWAGPIALFIADAHDAVPELLAALDAERAENERLRGALRDAADQVAERDDEIGTLSARVAELERELKVARERWTAGLRRADDQVREMNAELRRYADGDEQPVLWSVYNAMHKRASAAEARVNELVEQRVNELVEQRDDALVDLVVEGAAGIEPGRTPAADHETPASVAAAELRAMDDTTVTSCTAITDAVLLTLTPRTVADWDLWVDLLGIDWAQVTHRGATSTGRGSWDGVSVAVRVVGLSALLLGETAAGAGESS